MVDRLEGQVTEQLNDIHSLKATFLEKEDQLEKLQKKHPEAKWAAGDGEVIQAGGLRIVVGSPSAKGWYNIVVEGREMDEGDRYGFHPKYGWAKQRKPSYAIQEALNEHDPNTFPIALR